MGFEIEVEFVITAQGSPAELRLRHFVSAFSHSRLRTFRIKEGRIVNVLANRSDKLRRRLWVNLLVLTVVLTFCSALLIPPLSAQEPGSTTGTAADSTPSGVGMQAGSALATILYFPFKAAFALGGGIVGGLAYAFSGGSEQTAKSIWIPSIYGTYIITPDHLKGDKPIRFLGVPNDARDASDVPVQEPAPLPLEPVR
jgi:hypothetical protein